jgi:hypothetical protein
MFTPLLVFTLISPVPMNSIRRYETAIHGSRISPRSGRMTIAQEFRGYVKTQKSHPQKWVGFQEIARSHLVGRI